MLVLEPNFILNLYPDSGVVCVRSHPYAQEVLVIDNYISGLYHIDLRDKSATMHYRFVR